MYVEVLELANKSSWIRKWGACKKYKNMLLIIFSGSLIKNISGNLNIIIAYIYIITESINSVIQITLKAFILCSIRLIFLCYSTCQHVNATIKKNYDFRILPNFSKIKFFS